MIFKRIKLKNFRQYKDEISFEFSQPKDGKNNITLLIAANGVGKTTLLQAFRYCFYGKSANYLNLPTRSELVNNTVVDDLRDLDETNMFIEVKFEHDGTDYIAIREAHFFKTKSILKEKGEETFSLTQLTEKSAYKAFKEAEANDKIRSILPEGLSQVFMFDGERMERNISDKRFSGELKESILGILDIKKYDKLIEIIGYPGKLTSVLGLLASKKKTSSLEEQRIKKHYEELLESELKLESDITSIQEEIREIVKKVNINTEQQIKSKENKERALEKVSLEDKIENNRDKIRDLSRRYIRESKQALIYKLMLRNKRKYDDFINKGKKIENFYSYLHVDTLQDIQEKEVCVCGRPVKEHTVEYLRLEELKKTSLPIESSQHLNLISQKFKQCAGFKSQISQLNEIREEIAKNNEANEKYEEKIHVLTQDISKVEKLLGITNQQEIDDLLVTKDSMNIELGKNKSNLELVKKAINNLSRKIEKIDKGNVYNQKINRVIDVVNRMKETLEKKKLELDQNARYILAKHFNHLLAKTIHGKYDVIIDDRYQISIKDLGNGKDVTNLLNTGHNVVISLTFISALIQTAKELSEKVSKNEKYGVLMDAALSNLDETHIDRLCRNTLNNLDQLIFLSFKRQLRDEMYMGIQDNIGLAYQIEKTDTGKVFHNRLDLNVLGEYIHSLEEE